MNVFLTRQNLELNRSCDAIGRCSSDTVLLVVRIEVEV